MTGCPTVAFNPGEVRDGQDGRRGASAAVRRARKPARAVPRPARSADAGPVVRVARAFRRRDDLGAFAAARGRGLRDLGHLHARIRRRLPDRAAQAAVPAPQLAEGDRARRAGASALSRHRDRARRARGARGARAAHAAARELAQPGHDRARREASDAAASCT